MARVKILTSTDSCRNTFKLCGIYIARSESEYSDALAVSTASSTVSTTTKSNSQRSTRSKRLSVPHTHSITRHILEEMRLNEVESLVGDITQNDLCVLLLSFLDHADDIDGRRLREDGPEIEQKGRYM